MNRQLVSIVWPLVVLNVVAVALWLASSRWRVVLANPLRHRRPEVGPFRFPAIGAALRRQVDHLVSAVRSPFRTVRQRKEPAARHPTAADPPVDGLDAWIDEVEQQETRPAAGSSRSVPADAESGSEAWWRAWAESGGALPEAAESCRHDDRRSDPEAAFLG